jgi:hypothetical protein
MRFRSPYLTGLTCATANLVARDDKTPADLAFLATCQGVFPV